MENIWQNLFAPEAKVCGVWLGKYTLWHHALLSAFQSPFLDDDPEATATPADLLIAVSMCSTEWPNLPRTKPHFWRMPWIHRMRTEESFRRQAVAFASWLGAHISGPVFWKNSKKNGGGLTAPDVYSLVYGMTSKCGLNEAAAWSKSPGQAETILGAVAELEGAELHFADPEELAQEESREEVYQQAIKDLGPDVAEQFIRGWDRIHN